MHSKLAKRVLGALVSAAVMVSMIPAMALADGEDGLKEVTFSFSGTVYSGETATANGFVLSPVGGQVGNNRYFGVDEYGTDPETGESLDPNLEDDIVGNGTFTFSLDPAGAYAGGEITKIVINISGGPNNMAFVEGTDNGWSTFESGAFTWAPKTEGASFDRVSLTLDATTGQGHYFNYGSITITVRVPVDSITVEPDESEDNDFMYVDDDSFFVVATVDPETTTYDDVYMTWASSDEGVFKVDDYEDNLAELAPVAPGTATITASLGGVDGTYDVTVYDHVAGAAITAPEGPFYVGYQYELTVAPTNPAANLHEGDWEVTSWSSDDTDIATVTKADDGSGQVVALAATDEGEPVEITAVITDTVTQETWEATFEMNIAEVPATTMFRLFYEDTGEHLYTANAGERDYLKNHGWNYEGGAWLTPTTSNTPVYRLFNPNNGEHFYSSNLGEIEGLVAIGWRNEDIAFYADDFRTVAVYRLFNPAAQSNTHIYSTDAGEISYLVAHGWLNEGPAFYASGLMNAS